LAIGLAGYPSKGVYVGRFEVFARATGPRNGAVAGRLLISVPPGLVVEKGDTLVSLKGDAPDRAHRLSLRATRSGSFEIVGRLEVKGANGMDFAAAILPVTCSGDTCAIGDEVLTSVESVRSGRRFRYALDWVIPMDSTETYDSREFARVGQKPRIEGVVPTVAWSGVSDTLRFVAVIDPQGRVAAATAVGQTGGREAGMIQAAEAALARTHFRPAVVAGRPVSDWVLVRVPIHP